MTESEHEFTHIDAEGRLRMVDVGEKEVTHREARAEAVVILTRETLDRILDLKMPKGNVFEAARLAGILAAKKTADLIPLCHPIQLTDIKIDFSTDRASKPNPDRFSGQDPGSDRGRNGSAGCRDARSAYDLRHVQSG